MYNGTPDVMIVKCRRLSWTGHIAMMGRQEMHAEFLNTDKQMAG